MDNKESVGNCFTPKIVSFCCLWGAYELLTRQKTHDAYTQNIRFITMMCGGMITPALILRAFELGADGVLIITCPGEDCHYNTGAREALDVYKRTEDLIHMLGIERERLMLVSSSWDRAHTVQRFIDDFTEVLLLLGPSSFKELRGNHRINE